MDIPSFKSIMLPFLQYIDDLQEHHRKNIADALAAKPFKLTPEQRAELMPNGVPVFDYRCDWAKTILKKADLVEIPRRGYSKITDRGLAFLDAWESNPKEIEDAVMKSPAKFYDYVNNGWPVDDEEDNSQTLEESTDDEEDNSQALEESTESVDDDQNSEESIEENYQQIRKQLAKELLQKIKDNTPTFFEGLVVDLLVKMGYGGSREDAGRAVGRSGDGGIDGIINEDRLGLDAIYIQAKRWGEGNVGSPDIDKFSGALNRKGASKGVFITTSRFTDSAKDAVKENTGLKIVLIDGEQLAQLMIDHDVGVSTTKTYEIKRVDSDYFAENTE